MGANEVFELFAAPFRFDVVLRQQQNQQRTLLDLGQQVVAEIVAGPELVIDEEPLLEDIRPFIEVRSERRDPPMLNGRTQRDAVVRMGVADEHVESRISGQLPSTVTATP